MTPTPGPSKEEVEALVEDHRIMGERMGISMAQSASNRILRLARSWLAQREILEEVAQEPCIDAEGESIVPLCQREDGSVSCLPCRARAMTRSVSIREEGKTSV